MMGFWKLIFLFGFPKIIVVDLDGLFAGMFKIFLGDITHTGTQILKGLNIQGYNLPMVVRSNFRTVCLECNPIRRN